MARYQKLYWYQKPLKPRNYFANLNIKTKSEHFITYDSNGSKFYFTNKRGWDNARKAKKKLYFHFGLF